MITLIIIALTCVVSFLAFQNIRLMNDLILWPPAINRNREYYRLVTYGLIHADTMHLFVNMLTLYFFGKVMEGLYSSHMGMLGFATFYIGGLVVSILPTYLHNKDNASYRSLGASGAVSAVLFAYVLVAPWTTIRIFFVLPMPAIVYAVLYVAYSVMMDRTGKDNVNHSAHLWGAAYGVAVTLMIQPSLVSHFINEISQPRFGFMN
ncbi:membrane associated rhomboid family serine protease [Luteibacter sp. Sphag1AF]|uniref:rhomboid family intramembrane serine protease n=1 Tax=Luteibacter sp. Sphag1AF TaxID=2587031 RepID=UPI00161539DA|nr:rhomboid family intramembrane serine protease [Luteibacter sp. Sphag1AF]MBB3228300.1 membrane associated rhomboid family serine protease [Luteibacter sp. Sphag1AF]